MSISLHHILFCFSFIKILFNKYTSEPCTLPCNVSKIYTKNFALLFFIFISTAI